MSFDNYKYGSGLSNVGSYQVSGKPFLTSSVVPASGAAAPTFTVSFPAVTKQIVLSNNSQTNNNDIRVAYAKNGVRDEIANYFILHAAKDGVGYLTLDAKCTEIYFMSDGSHTPEVSVHASLTGIDVERINNISPSGSNWSGSSGVG